VVGDFGVCAESCVATLGAMTVVRVRCVLGYLSPKPDVTRSGAIESVRIVSQLRITAASYQYERAGCLMRLLLAFATYHVLWRLQLLQVEVMLTAVAMYAVPERTQAFA
jgi:hypothetical protein